MDSWRDIKMDPPPKDGTKIDLWVVRLEYGTAETFDGRREADVWWGRPHYGGDDFRDPSWIKRTGPWIESVVNEPYRATHWMPPPKAPEPPR